MLCGVKISSFTDKHTHTTNTKYPPQPWSRSTFSPNGLILTHPLANFNQKPCQKDCLSLCPRLKQCTDPLRVMIPRSIFYYYYVMININTMEVRLSRTKITVAQIAHIDRNKVGKIKQRTGVGDWIIIPVKEE